MHNEGDMKHEASEPATKGDLERFATKTDLERFATKTDLELLAIRTDLERFAMKTDLERFATKTDLERFATKTDLELLAIRSDLERFATKTDLERFATKTEAAGMTMRIDRVESVLKNVAVEVSGIKSELTDMRQDFSAALTRTESRLIDHLDGFMAKTLKVERDEVWLIHRVDKLEDRVTRIEKKSP